jgi:FO synthase
VHAIARLALNPYLTNIQASWVKMGHRGVIAALNAGCNDLGGTLMNESITRAAGATHGQETSPQQMHSLIESAGRLPRQRTTAYQDASQKVVARGLEAAELDDIINTPARKYDHERTHKLVKNAIGVVNLR